MFRKKNNAYDTIIHALREDPGCAEWRDEMIKKLQNKQAGTDDFLTEFDSSDFEKLLEWSLKNKKADIASILLKGELYEESYNLVIKNILNKVMPDNTDATKILLTYSEYLREGINTFRGNSWYLKHGVCGCTMLQNSALEANIVLCNFLITLSPQTQMIDDFFGNNCLHYASSSGNKECYDYFYKLNPDWANKKNMFGHVPQDYFPENIIKLVRMEQNVLIRAFINYSVFEKRDIDIENLKKGICTGHSFLTALHSLRGHIARENYYAMQELIINWNTLYEKFHQEKIDETAISIKLKEALNEKITNPHLSQLGFKTIADVFEYLINHYSYYYAVDKIDFSRSDAPHQLALINMGEDQLMSEFDLSSNGLSKKDCQELIETNLNSNTLIRITAVPEGIGVAMARLGGQTHAIAIAIDADNKIYYCEPNLPYRPLPLQSTDIDMIMNLLYSKKIVADIRVCTYTPNQKHTLEKKAAVPIMQQTNKSLFNKFLVSQDGHEDTLMSQACMSDSPHTLLSIIKAMKEGGKDLSEERIHSLLSKASKNNSYQCIEVLLNQYKDEYNLSIDALADEAKQHYQNYLQNKQFKPRS